MPSTKPKIPNELKDLASFLQGRGYTLAIPFDNVRKPGYIGTYSDEGQEIIVDTGKCLKDFVVPESGGTALGSYKKSSKFSLKGFLKIFGDVFGLDFNFLKVKNVSISFPSNIIKTDFITLVDIEEDWAKISPACTKRIADPKNFLIVQVLVTDSIGYSYTTSNKLDVNAKAELEKKVAAAAKAGKFEVNVSYESDTNFEILVKDIPLSIGYKTARVSVQPITP
jgi:hypothetical protein